MPKKESKSNTFEEKLKLLEKIVLDLESGNISLDESIKKYEEGVKLYQNCRKKLVDAEAKISILTDKLVEDEVE